MSGLWPAGFVKFWSSGLLRDTIPRFEGTNATASLALILAHLDEYCNLPFHGSWTLPRDSTPLRTCTATTCSGVGFMFAHLNPPSDRPASPIPCQNQHRVRPTKTARRWRCARTKPPQPRPVGCFGARNRADDGTGGWAAARTQVGGLRHGQEH